MEEMIGGGNERKAFSRKKKRSDRNFTCKHKPTDPSMDHMGPDSTVQFCKNA
jgi:hypothetical protein